MSSDQSPPLEAVPDPQPAEPRQADQLVQIQAILAGKIGFASHQNSVAVLRDLSVANLGNEEHVELTLELTADPPFPAAKSWHIDRLDAGVTLQVASESGRSSQPFGRRLPAGG